MPVAVHFHHIEPGGRGQLEDKTQTPDSQAPACLAIRTVISSASLPCRLFESRRLSYLFQKKNFCPICACTRALASCLLRCLLQLRALIHVTEFVALLAPGPSFEYHMVALAVRNRSKLYYISSNLCLLKTHDVFSVVRTLNETRGA